VRFPRATHLLFGFERKEDAEKVLAVLGKRLGRFGLRLAPDKTRLVEFGRPSISHEGKGPGSFVFLGFTHYWRKTWKGKWQPAWKTSRKSLRKAIVSLQKWCRTNRHQSIPLQHKALTLRIQGHFNYFGVNGNHRSMGIILKKVELCWIKWLRRRSQRTRMTFERFYEMLKAFPLPKVKVYRNLWASQ
jgi:RNA-directed DNA polymerase